MRNKIIMLVLSVALAVSLAAVGCAEPEAAKPTVLRMVDHSVAESVRGDALNIFKESVEELTNGRVQIELYFAESLLEEAEFLAGTKEGTCDMCVVAPGKHIAELPHWAVLETCPYGPDLVQQIDFYWNLLDEIPELVEDYTNLNQKIFAFSHTPVLAIYTSKPCDTIWDLAGSSIRCYAQPHAVMMEVLGALPVSMPTAEAFTAMQRGTIDGTLTTFEAGYRFRFHEAVKGVTILYLSDMSPNSSNPFSINIDSFNKLSEADQKVLMDCGEEMTIYIANGIAEQVAVMRQEMIDIGCTIVDVPSEDQAQWRDDPRVDALPDEWAKKMGGNATEIVDKLRVLLAEATK